MATKIDDISIAKSTGTKLQLSTKQKYVNDDVFFNVSVINGVTAANTASADVDVQSTDGAAGGVNISSSIGTKVTSEPSSGYYIRMQASGSGSSKVTSAGWISQGNLETASTTAVKYFPINSAAASIGGTNTVTPSASVSGTNITLSNVNNGISVTATGGGTASASVSATTTAAGYVPNNSTLDTQTVAAGSQTTTASSYISGVTLTAPSSGTRSFIVNVPNGKDLLPLTITVDASGNWSIDNIPSASGVSF